MGNYSFRYGQRFIKASAVLGMFCHHVAGQTSRTALAREISNLQNSRIYEIRSSGLFCKNTTSSHLTKIIGVFQCLTKKLAQLQIFLTNQLTKPLFPVKLST